MGRAVRPISLFWPLLLALPAAYAGTAPFASTTLDAKGFQANQPYFGAGGQGSVNSYSGNLVISETDLSLPCPPDSPGGSPLFREKTPRISDPAPPPPGSVPGPT